MQIVPLPVALIELAPGPKYSIIAFVPPETVNRPARYIITSLGAVQPLISPVKCTPIRVGYLTSQGKPAMTSAASAPPTPIARDPNPPPFTVWESVPIISAPGNA